MKLLSGKKLVSIHILVWSCFLFFTGFQFYSEFNEIPSQFYYRNLLSIAVFYINYVYLVPKLLLKSKLWLYMLGVFVLLVVNVGANDALRPKFDGFPQRMPMEQQFSEFNENAPAPGPMPNFPDDFKKPEDNRPIMFRFLMPSVLTLLLIVLGAMVKMYSQWKITEETKKDIAAKKVSSELQFLKAQLNPHFLFNSLNTIYSLSVQKSATTPEAVINLSEMMRYMLYEADKDLVSLEKELEYVQNYIQLQRLRLVDSTDVSINVHGDYRNKKIQPLLFVSFIENAFKYGTNYAGKTQVKILITIEDTGLTFWCQNVIGSKAVDAKNSGIGLENVKSRLNLLYPNTHTLQITTKEKLYTVDLHIKFKNS